MTPEEQILICAVRYALGRMSYIITVVCDYVYFKRKTLSRECINIIIRDIEEEMERYHSSGELLGMECDERTWSRLLETLKMERDDTRIWRLKLLERKSNDDCIRSEENDRTRSD